jgi:tetratricopeptide (TPR) repeat protein
MSLYPKYKFLSDAAIRIYVYTSNYKKAIETFDDIYKDSKAQDIYPRLLSLIGIAYLKTGNNNGSDLFLNELISRSEKSPTGSPSFSAAAIYTARGENDKAIQSLEKGYADHEVEMYWLKVEPLFKPLHGDPRFENILKKIGFK